jgi:hypothetical protein
MKSVKFCRDCRYSFKISSSELLCAHPYMVANSPDALAPVHPTGVRGSEARKLFGKCGIRGSLWEANPVT